MILKIFKMVPICFSAGVIPIVAVVQLALESKSRTWLLASALHTHHISTPNFRLSVDLTMGTADFASIIHDKHQQSPSVGGPNRKHKTFNLEISQIECIK